MRFLDVLLTLSLLGAAVMAAEPAYRVMDFRAPPHNYSEHQPKDRFAGLLKQIEKGDFQPDTSSDQALLRSLLQGLKVPVSSQILLFSASSLQSEIINPRNPRALFFN